MSQKIKMLHIPSFFNSLNMTDLIDFKSSSNTSGAVTVAMDNSARQPSSSSLEIIKQNIHQFCSKSRKRWWPQSLTFHFFHILSLLKQHQVVRPKVKFQLAAVEEVAFVCTHYLNYEEKTLSRQTSDKWLAVIECTSSGIKNPEKGRWYKTKGKY